ncbi:MAG: hypothetical protein QOH35_983 [Acidobacteriaceae bacterium]|jgi:hypothetical protein|nr:hypothetical protein [Acidobacteriaceae bacterium]MEA2259471.1 hypothetical protein [Acidobacteriaceae bacterium]MEA2539617.1 hypothetical protein [Acidobacteriaceae bacterium]
MHLQNISAKLVKRLPSGYISEISGQTEDSWPVYHFQQSTSPV